MKILKYIKTYQQSKKNLHITSIDSIVLKKTGNENKGNEKPFTWKINLGSLKY